MGASAERADERHGDERLRGYYRKVAVGCWFTASGRVFPRLIKYEDEEGERHLIEHIYVLRADKPQYSRLIVQKYDCRAEIGGRYRDFSLLYHPGENFWDMVLPEI